MTPPEEHHRYREQIGAFLLGKLDGGERTALQTHLNSCPICQAEVRELEPVVAALADAAPDRIEEEPLPPWHLEESTLAPILGEKHRVRRRSGRFRWSTLAAAAICVVAIGLAGFTSLLEPAVALEPLSFSVARGVEVDGHLIKHDWGTEIRLVVSGSRDGQTYRVTLVSEDGEPVNAGTFIGIGDKTLRGTFNAALLRKEADRLEVRTPGGEPVFFAKLREEPLTVRDWPLFGILPWADLDLPNKTMGSSGSESTEEPGAKDPAPADKQEKPKDPGSGGGTLPKGSSPESDPKRSPPGGASSASPDPGAAPGAGGQESVPPDAGQESVPPDAGQESASPAAGKRAAPASASPAADQY
jgi:Putative zinc-finger